MLTGEIEAWDKLSALDPQDVRARSGAVLIDHGPWYTLDCFAQELVVSPHDRTITGSSALGAVLVNDLGCYSRLAMLWYLARAQNRRLSGRLIKPCELPGGDIYRRGTHMLPLDRLGARYSENLQAFRDRGAELGGRAAEYADASVNLKPFPHIGMTVLLWRGDDEFAPRSDLLLDATCGAQLPPDIIWSTAMMTVLLFLPGEPIPIV